METLVAFVENVVETHVVFAEKNLRKHLGNSGRVCGKTCGNICGLRKKCGKYCGTHVCVMLKRVEVQTFTVFACFPQTRHVFPQMFPQVFANTTCVSTTFSANTTRVFTNVSASFFHKHDQNLHRCFHKFCRKHDKVSTNVSAHFSANTTEFPQMVLLSWVAPCQAPQMRKSPLARLLVNPQRCGETLLGCSLSRPKMWKNMDKPSCEALCQAPKMWKNPCVTLLVKPQPCGKTLGMLHVKPQRCGKKPPASCSYPKITHATGLSVLRV